MNIEIQGDALVLKLAEKNLEPMVLLRGDEFPEWQRPILAEYLSMRMVPEIFGGFTYGGYMTQKHGSPSLKQEGIYLREGDHRLWAPLNGAEQEQLHCYLHSKLISYGEFISIIRNLYILGKNAALEPTVREPHRVL